MVSQHGILSIAPPREADRACPSLAAGVSFIFLAMDSSGAIFSLLSLVFKPKFDGLAAANYIGILVLEFTVFGLALVLNPRAKRRRRRQEEEQDEEKQEQPEGDRVDTMTSTVAPSTMAASTMTTM